MEIFNWLLLALRLPTVKVASTKIHAAVTYLQITFGNMPELLKMSPPPHNLQTLPKPTTDRLHCCKEISSSSCISSSV